MTFNPLAVPLPICVILTLISSSSTKIGVDITGWVVPNAFDVFWLLSMVNNVDNIVVPVFKISTVKVLPLVCAVVNEPLTSVSNMLYGILKVVVVPVTSAVTSSEHEICITDGKF